MGDMGDIWQGYKEHRQARSEINRKQNEPKLQGWTLKSPYHAQIITPDGPIDWWFTRNKWQFRQKIYAGTCPKWLQILIKETLQND